MYSQTGHKDLKMFRFSSSKRVLPSNLPLPWWPQGSCDIQGSLRCLEVPRAPSLPKCPWMRLRVWSFQVLNTPGVIRKVVFWPNILLEVSGVPGLTLSIYRVQKTWLPDSLSLHQQCLAAFAYSAIWVKTYSWLHSFSAWNIYSSIRYIYIARDKISA